ncbi:MAG TPA: hypothetical protein VL486_02980 [Verrucomicrobiae bacterium]|nr:hypothetical protein [Verrucomicrobiae bacterium]
MVKIFMGVVFMILGFSGLFVLRGTHSGTGLAAFGMLLIIWGVAQESTRRGRRPSAYEESVASSGFEETEKTPEPHMDESELEQWIAGELGRMQSPDALIAQVCERGGLRWEDSKELINRVQTRHGEAIHRRRRQMTVFAGIPIIVGGVTLLACSTFAFLHHSIVIRGTDTVHPYVYYGFALGSLMTIGGLYGTIRGR